MPVDPEPLSTQASTTALSELKQQRGTAKGSLTRIKKYVEEREQLDPTELECRLGLFESYYKQAIHYQAQIERLSPTDTVRAEIDELYITVKSRILRSIGQKKEPTTEQSFVFPEFSSSRLPKLRLPHFEGEYIEYKNFMSSFLSLVDSDKTIPVIEKFNHLISCLGGEALSTIKAFPICEANYKKALERLEQRYDNDTLIFLETVASMFDVAKVTKPDSKQIRKVTDTLSALYNSLKSLGSFENICDAFVIYLALSKVDSDTHQKWNEHLDYTAVPTWSECRLMLDKRCQQLEATNKRCGKQTPTTPSASASSQSGKPKQHSLHTKTKPDRSCIHCSKQGHLINTCQRFLVLPTEQRMEFAKKQHCCINCLAKGHGVSQCPSKYSCRFCKQRHHSLLHKYDNNQHSQDSSATTILQGPSSSGSREPSSSQSTFAIINHDTVILATALILLRDVNGEFQLARALLDSGSQVNLMTEAMAQTLQLKKLKTSQQLAGIGSASIKTNHEVKSTIRSRLSTFELTSEFLLTSTITGYHPNKRIAVNALNLPNNIDLADPEFYVPKGIDVLLGAKIFFTSLSSGQIQLGTSLPTLQQTQLGWIVSGEYAKHHGSKHSTVACIATMESLNNRVEKFWQINEDIGKRQVFTKEQVACEEHFVKTTSVNSENRIIVELPFKMSPNLLGNSRDIAEQRFLSLERRFKRNHSLKNDYSLFLKEYEELGHMELAENLVLQEPHYYIPHHCVLKPSSTSTKLRVVFDASCRSASQKSLNDMLMVGPTIQNDLVITLLRFRCHRYGLNADITKMYRQILVHPSHRNFQLILWRSDESQPLSTYKLNTVTYGTAAAPFLALRSLRYAAENYPYPTTLGASIVKTDFYVDDMITGADDLQTLQTIKKEVTELLAFYNFPLTKWHCNHPAMTTNSSHELPLEPEITSTLGIRWQTSNDTFTISYAPRQVPSNFTKRLILSITSSMFDPMGLVSPLLIQAKIILQQLWLLKYDWDQEVSEEINTKFTQVLHDLKNASYIEIPRYVCIPNKIAVQVHGFSDASIKAYGCCIYLRAEDDCGNIAVHLLASKSRLAPLKVQTLPRLELAAAHLLCKFWSYVSSYLELPIADIYFWSDSQITLHWIKAESSTLSTFVGNRVAAIQECSTTIEWRHVSSEDNPADLISRGCTVQQLIDSCWLQGPSFLQHEIESWPSRCADNLSSEDLNLEKRRSCLHAADTPVPAILQKVREFNYIKCLRVFALVLRVRQPTIRDSPAFISAAEMKTALNRIAYVIQQHHYQEEISLLRKNKTLTSQLAHLSPFLSYDDNIELLRVGGRLVNANIPEDTKFPLLLPKSEPFVKIIATYFHQSNYHAGPRALVAILQQQFWIVNCRSLARQVVHECVACTRYKPKLLTQVMGNLPRDRVQADRPFNVTGVDFAGPIDTYLKIRGKRPYKAYIAVFVCFWSKAVHLEAVTDLSSDAFIAALKRFIGRRGSPSKLYCDNATNFVGANSKLKEFRSQFLKANNVDATSSYCAVSNIHFTFIPPRAPHFGGLWEAAVKSAKGHLYRTLANAHLTFEELTTSLVEIEAVMNSRPIAALSSDPNDLQVLTPAHFLIGCSLKHIPESINEEVNISLIQRWRRITTAKAHFWRRWYHEYLNELRNRTRWTKPEQNIKVGDLVLIHDDNLPPMKWLMGRVITTVLGKDNYVRVADVKTSSTVLRRPIAKLAVLPIN